MRPQTSKLTDRAWAEIFSHNLSTEKQILPTGEGWKTLQQIAVIGGLHQSKASRVISASVKLGKLDVFIGKAIGKSGVANKQVWYRPVKSVGKK